jgi:hypothetical protein
MKTTNNITKMKTSILLLTILVLSCTGQAAEKQSVVAANPVLIGKWTGEGRFLDVAVDKDLGKVPLEVEINKDNTVTGRIGDAKLTQTSIKKARYGFEIHGMLDSKINKNKAEKKDHLIILLVTPVKDKEGALVSEANFHLKSNYTLDLNMSVGGVMLKKQP